MTAAEFSPDLGQFVDNALYQGRYSPSQAHPFALRSDLGFRSGSDVFQEDFFTLGAERLKRSFLSQVFDATIESALARVAHLGAELLLEIALDEGILSRGWRVMLPQKDLRRFLYVPSDGRRPPVILVLDPAVHHPPALLTQRISPDNSAEKVLARIAVRADRTNMSVDVAHAVGQIGPTALREMLDVARPELILARKPAMERLCAPWPHIDVQCGHKLSTAGIFCRNETGELGVTACYHGTGQAGTEVDIGLKKYTIAAASEVQDIVFVPLGTGYNIPQLRAVGGIYPDQSPPIYQNASFWGASSGQRNTRILSTDAYVFRHRPTMQLRLQTEANTNTGDSGAALISSDDLVLGFAFERTAYGEFPEMTDWIWAANALRALKLTPY